MRIGVYSTYGDGNGISNYTKELFSDLANVTIIPIDRLASQHANPLRVIKSRRYFKQLAQQSAGYDVIHIQHEYSFFARDMSRGLLGSIFDYHRSFFENIKAPYVITPHELPEAGARYSLGLKEATGLKKLLKQLYNTVFRTQSLDLYINTSIFSSAVLVYVHTLRQKSLLEKQKITSTLLPLAILKANGREKPIDKVSNLGLIGYIAERKGTHLAVEALINLPEAMSLKVLGGVEKIGETINTEYLKQINNYIRQHKLSRRVDISGYLQDNEMLEQVKSLDLVIAPFRQMNGSGSLAIAIALNIPILASDLPETRELVELGVGMEVFKDYDSKAIAEKISQLSKSPDKLNAMMNKSKLYAQKYSVASTQQKILVDYQKVVKHAN